MLRSTPRRIGDRPVRSAELRPRDNEQVAPEALSRVEIETLMQVEPNPQPGFIDLETAPQPGDEHAKDRRIGVRHAHLAIAF